MKAFAFAVLFLISLNGFCQTNGASNSDVFNQRSNTLVGFNKLGRQITCEGFLGAEDCQIVATRFTDHCLNQGSEILVCRDCRALCSAPVEK